VATPTESGGRFSPEATLRSTSELHTMYFIYGIEYAAMASIIALLNLHALRRAGALGLDPMERSGTRAIAADVAS